jgi:hypothetical protein
MQSCPKCGSAKVRVTEGALWMLHCCDCGFEVSGTASFAHHIEVEKECAVVLTLSSVQQISAVRSIAPELSQLSAAELLRAARVSGLRLTVPSLPMWRARECVEQATSRDIKAEIQREEKEA